MSSAIAASLSPPTSRNRSREAEMTSAKEPNLASRLFASEIAARDGAKKNQFEKFVFSERRGASLHQP